MRWAVLFSWVVSQAACVSAPPAEDACRSLCDNRTRCGQLSDDRTCMWWCLAGIEHRADKSSRCGLAIRDEIDCLGGINDCEFLLFSSGYRDGDPCSAKGSTRVLRCNEDGVPGDELVPLSGPEVWSEAWGDDYSDPSPP